MVIAEVGPEILLPLVDNKVIFFDIPRDMPKSLVLEIFKYKKCRVFKHEDEKGIRFLGWFFTSQNFEDVYEVGFWVRKDAKDDSVERARATLDVVFDEGINIVYGMVLSINTGTVSFIKKLGGQLYHKVDKVVCHDGRKRDITLCIFKKGE